MRHHANAFPLRPALAATLAASLAALVHAGAGPDDPTPTFTSSALLAPALLRGPHHTVDAAVRTEGYFHYFAISSPEGRFEAEGLSQVGVLVQEIDAIVSLKDVSKTEVFLSAAGRSVVNLGKGAAAVVSDPAGTAKGLGAGFKRAGVNLGRRTQRAVDSARGEDEGTDQAGQDSAAASAAKSLLGVNAALRRWAQKVGVDPYTRNAVLLETLGGIAKVDAAGAIATKVALPIPRVVGMTATVGKIVWGQDPEALRKTNEQALRELRVGDTVAAALFRNPAYTLTTQTRLIAALHTVQATGSDDYVRTAAEAKSAREALFFVESAELLQAWHARAPVKRLLKDSRALVAGTAQGHATALLPLDWVPSTAASTTALRDITARVNRELAATRRTLVLTGQASSRAKSEIAALGWTIVPPPR